MSDSIEIEINGPKLTPDRFEQAVREFFVLIEGVARNMNSDAKDEDWTVEVRAGSTIVRAKANTRVEAAINAVRAGIQSLESGVRSAPKFFTKEEIRAARNLAAVVDDYGKFVNQITIKNGDAPILLSREIIKTADAILAGESQIAFGSFEGLIESFHHKEGQPFTCSIHDPLYKRSIVCSFTTAEAEEIAYASFRPPKRVLVHGLIYYSKEGTPLRINVNIVRVFPDEDKLPSVEDIQAFY